MLNKSLNNSYKLLVSGVVLSILILMLMVNLFNVNEQNLIIASVSICAAFYIYVIFSFIKSAGRSVILVSLISILLCFFQLINGAFIESPYNRFFINVFLYTLVGIVIYNKLKSKYSFGQLMLILFAPPLIILFPFGSFFGDWEFYPLVYCPVFSLLFIHIFNSIANKFIAVFLIGAVTLLSSFLVYPLYWTSINGKRIENELAQKDQRIHLEILNENGDTITLNRFDDKIILIDLWYSKCSACYKSFPKLERLFQQYKNDTNVFIGSLNIPLATDSFKFAFDALSQYSFGKLKSVTGINENYWAINSYPTIIVLDKHKRLRYSGSLFTDELELSNNIHNIIEDIKNEN